LRMFPDEFSSDVPHVLNLTQQTAFEQFKQADGLRGASDRVTRPTYWVQKQGKARDKALALGKMADRAQAARAASFRKMIAELKKSAKGGG
jgi:hypothetical protein